MDRPRSVRTTVVCDVVDSPIAEAPRVVRVNSRCAPHYAHIGRALYHSVAARHLAVNSKGMAPRWTYWDPFPWRTMGVKECWKGFAACSSPESRRGYTLGQR